jgi:tRNA A58 N-methylase Trm61
VLDPLENIEGIDESVSKINETVIDIRADPEHIEHASEHVFAQGEEAIFEQVGENSELTQEK